MMKDRFILTALTALLIFCGCSNKDDEKDNSSLIGRWEAIREVNEPDYSHLDYEYEEGEEVIEFTADQMITYYFGEKESSYQYSYSNGTLTVAGFNMKVDVSSSQLKLYEESIDDEPISSYTLYKKIS